LNGSRHRVWQLLLAIALSALLLWWAFRDVNLEEALGYLRAVRLGWLLAAVVVATSLFPLRLVRWRLLLRRENGDPYPWTPLWHAIAMGFAANNLLPFRAGEVVRTVAASRLTGARLTEALFSGKRSVFPLSSVLDGFHGLSGVALSVPSLVSSRGIERVLQVPMDAQEITMLKRSAATLKESLKALGF